MDQRKIVHIIPNLSRGGAERFVVDLCNALSDKSAAEIHLISMYNNPAGTTLRKEVHAKVIYHELSKRPGLDMKFLYRLFQLLRRIEPDVVHTHINTLEYALPYTLRYKKATHFHTLHNDAFMECDKPFLRKVRQRCYASKSVVPITISRESSRSFHACYKQKGDLIIENGVRPIEKRGSEELIKKRFGLQAQEQQYLLVNVARIAQQKNQEMLVDAVKKINAEGTIKCVLAIVGDVQDAAIFQRLQAKQDEHIHFTGAVNNIGDYLAAADAFCLSSVYEGMPISLLEAMSIGCIPVCTPVGGIPEMISHQHTGFLSKDLSLSGYIEAIKAALLAPNRDEVKNNCRHEFFSKYHIHVSMEKHVKAYGSREK